jgi:hypothetical protein
VPCILNISFTHESSITSYGKQKLDVKQAIVLGPVEIFIYLIDFNSPWVSEGRVDVSKAKVTFQFLSV